jgi:exodeoxyribonuclease VII small subunit
MCAVWTHRRVETQPRSSTAGGIRHGAALRVATEWQYRRLLPGAATDDGGRSPDDPTRQPHRETVIFFTRMETSIKDFEAAIGELEAIVRKLEEGDLPLEKSLELYERGVQLSRFCHARLEEAERRIEILNERGELKPAPPVLGLPGQEDR